MQPLHFLCPPDTPDAVPSRSAVQQCCEELYPPSLATRAVLELDWSASTDGVGNRAVGALLKLPHGTGGLVTHDNRGAPLVLLPHPPPARASARERLLLSLTDEGPGAAALAVCAKTGAALRGVGIDLAAVREFSPDAHGARFAAFVLTERELSFVNGHPMEQRAVLACALFSAKEAAIKSLAPLVRRHALRSCALRPVARCRELEVSPHPDRGLVTAAGETAEHLRRIGVRELRCSIRLGHSYVCTMARCLL